MQPHSLRRRGSGNASTPASRPPTAPDEPREVQARSIYVQHQLEIGKYVADSTKRERLAPQRAARELYIAPSTAVGLRSHAGGSPPPALPALAGATRATAAGVKRSAGELIEQNRALKQRCDDYRLHTEVLTAKLSAAEAEIETLQERVGTAEAEQERLRADLKHIAHRNEVLEQMNEALHLEKQKADAARAEAQAAAAAAKAAAGAGGGEGGGAGASMSVTSAEADAVSADAAGPLSPVAEAPPAQSGAAAAKQPTPPQSPAQTNSFIQLVERGLSRQLQQVEAAGGPSGGPDAEVRHSRRISLRSQLRQLTAMQTEVHQLQAYAEAVQAFSAKLATQLSSKQADNAALSARLREQHAEAEAALRQLNEELTTAETNLAQQKEAAREWEARAMVAEGSVSQLNDELSASASQLSTMREHMDQMLTLHEGLSEAAIEVGADAAVSALIEDLGNRLGGSLAMDLAGQLDEQLARMATRDAPPSAESPMALRPPVSPAPVTPSSASAAGSARRRSDQAVAKTRTNFMVARRYLLSTRQKQLEREARAASQSPANSARAGSSQEPSPPSQPPPYVSKPYLRSSPMRLHRPSAADSTPSTTGGALPPLADANGTPTSAAARGRARPLLVVTSSSTSTGASPARSPMPAHGVEDDVQSAAAAADGASVSAADSRARTRLQSPAMHSGVGPAPTKPSITLTHDESMHEQHDER